MHTRPTSEPNDFVMAQPSVRNDGNMSGQERKINRVDRLASKKKKKTVIAGSVEIPRRHGTRNLWKTETKLLFVY